MLAKEIQSGGDQAGASATLDAASRASLETAAKESHEAAAAFVTQQQAEKIDLHVKMPSGCTATLTQVSTDYCLADICQALKVIERKEERKHDHDFGCTHHKHHCPCASQSFGLTLVYGGKHLQEGRALKSYNIQNGSTLFALLRVLGGKVPHGKRPNSICAWIEGAYHYTCCWNHVEGAQYCKIFDSGAEDRWVTEDHRHVYQAKRPLPPLAVSVKVLDAHDRTINYTDAEVMLVCDDTGEVIRMGKGSLRSAIIENIGNFRFVARLKAHTQTNHLEAFLIDPAARSPELCFKPLNVVLTMKFEARVEVEVFCLAHQCPERPADPVEQTANANPQSGSGGAANGVAALDEASSEELSHDQSYLGFLHHAGHTTVGGSTLVGGAAGPVRQPFELGQARVAFHASDGSAVSFSRVKGHENRRQGSLKIPNTYRIVASLSNFEQCTLTKPVNFDKSQWLEADGVLKLQVTMKLVPKIFVEVVDSFDQHFVLPSAKVHLVELLGGGSSDEDSGGKARTVFDPPLPHKERDVLPNREGPVWEFDVDIPKTFMVRVKLPNRRQVDYTDQFLLEPRSWPMDRALKLTVRMDLEAQVNVNVVDPTGRALPHTSVRMVDVRTSGEFVFGAPEPTPVKRASTKKLKAATHTAMVACPGRYRLCAFLPGFEQTNHLTELELHRATWPTAGPLELTVNMTVDPAFALLGEHAERSLTPLFLVDISASMGNRRRLDIVKHVLSSVLAPGRCRFEAFNLVAFSDQAFAWRPHMTVVEQSTLAQALEWIERLSPMVESSLTAAMTKVKVAGKGADRIFFLTDGGSNNTLTAMQTEVELGLVYATSQHLRAPVHVVSLAVPKEKAPLLRRIANMTEGSFRQVQQPALDQVYLPVPEDASDLEWS